MIINIRGTSGSGKSTLVSDLISEYAETGRAIVNFTKEGRKQPTGQVLQYENGNGIYIPGHYRTACGGCDTINGLDEIYALVREGVDLYGQALFEGLIVCSDATRLIKLREEYGRENVLVIFLNTPIEECISSVQARREARGNMETLNPKNTIAKHKTNESVKKRFLAADVWVEELDRAQAAARIRELLGV